VAIDIGTGSGSAVLRRAAREPAVFFVALDSDARAMADASRRAARPPRKGGRDNVVFLVAAAEELPGPLGAVADAATVILPWGSLLLAVLNPESCEFAGIMATLKPGGELTVLVSASERDKVAGTIELDEMLAAKLAAAYECRGLTVIERRIATREDIEQLSSGWGKRLAIPARRSAWILRLRVT